MNIVVLAGGLSPERDVSLTSGTLIANALTELGHRVLLLDLYLGLQSLPENPLTLFRTEPVEKPIISTVVPDLEQLKRESGNGDALIGKNVIELCRLADMTFLALHGGIGENGQLQATLDCFGIKYTGSGYLASAMGMDKDVAKRIFKNAGVPTPKWVYFDVNRDSFDGLLKTIGLPCVVKPTDCGSSVGVSIVETEEELKIALKKASCYGSRVLVEQKITGRELTVGILDGTALPAVEILPDSGWYDYKNKYQGTVREICPADLPASVRIAAEQYALKGFRALRLKGYARFDFLLDESGRLWCLEANTLPGMTPTSLLPMAAKEAGYSYKDLCQKILDLSL